MAAGVSYLRFRELEPRTLDPIPDPRSGHRIVVDGGNLYSIGGYNPDFNERENDADTYYPLFKVMHGVLPKPPKHAHKANIPIWCQKLQEVVPLLVIVALGIF